MTNKAYAMIALFSLLPLAAAADEAPPMPSEAFAESGGEPELPTDAEPVTLSAPSSPGDPLASRCNASVYFISPKDGDTVKSPVKVRFGLKGMGIAPAGVKKDCTGHHHLIVDAPLPPADQPIESNENNLHFGGGQTEADVPLSRGEHSLQLMMGDHNHTPHNPAVASSQIRVNIE